MPDEYSTIQSGIDAAVDGDSVLVSVGTYVENITWPATNGIKLIGSGEDDCFIDGDSLASVIRFEENLGGIIDSTTLIIGFTIQNGHAQGVYLNNYGGGMFLFDSSPTLTDVIFSNNTSDDDGGGMYLRESSNPTLTDVIFSGNLGGTLGGGMYLKESSPTLMDVIFSNNTSFNGGGMCLWSSNPTLIDVTFSENMSVPATDHRGGGGMFLYDSSPILIDVIFSGNTAEWGGGGLYIWNSSPTLMDVIFSNNTSFDGGGIFLIESSPILNGATFSGNSANYGGGMSLMISSPTLTGVTFSGNSAGSRGGGIHLSESSSINGSYVLINNNYSEGHGAGIFIGATSNINLNNSTIASNMVGEGDTFGAGIYADGGTASLANSIVYYNRREGDYGGNYNLNGYTMDILDEYTVSYSDIEGDANWIPEGEGNISIAPEVNDFENGDFTLQSTSPCIDAGNPESDLDPDGTRVDMGAHYFDQSSSCDEGYTDIDGECYYQSDLDVLEDCIDNSSGTLNMDMDENGDGIIEPLELGNQEWLDGRLTELRARWNPGGGWIYAGLSGVIPPSIGDLTALTYLSLGGNELSGSIPPEIGSLNNLAFLSVWNNDLTGTIPPEIGDLENLSEIYLNTNQLTGTIPDEIEGLTNLIALALNSNQLTGVIPSWIGNLTNLSHLWLHYNDLSGGIPESLLEQTNLIHLMLSYNQFSGEISESIGNLTNLTDLKLDNNEFSGAIPESIGNLVSLNELTLQNNQFTYIPGSICNLTSLDWSAEYINLSYSYFYNNQFCPPYPECIEDYVGEQDTSNCVDECSGEVTISNQWSDGYNYDFTYTLGELTNYEDHPLLQIAQKEIRSLTVICEETGQIWSFDSNRIEGGNGNHDFSFLKEKYEDFPLPAREIENGVLIGIDADAMGNYHSLWFSVTAMDDEGNEFTHDNYVDTNPYGWDSSNEITFPGLDFTGTVDYANLNVLYAEGAYPVADIVYQIGGYGYYEGFECDETCQGSLSGSSCANSITIELHEGSNLTSFSVLPADNSVENVLISDNISAIAGEGEAAINTANGWVGSLTTILYENGYWILADEVIMLNLSGIPIEPDQLYYLHGGNNLISYSLLDCGSIDEVLPDEVEECIYAIAGEGVAALSTDNGWVGSLSELCPDDGYWFVNICGEITFTFEEPAELARKQEQNLSPNLYNQSSNQAFYFIEAIDNIEVGDWILAYSGDKVIGARQWQGSIIDVPAMGSDGSKYTEGYMETGGTPVFKMQRDGKLIDLEGYVPAWSKNGFHVVSSLTQAQTLPETFSLQRAYPNPFNPTTTLSFALPKDSNVILEIYDINGRKISKITDNNMKAGYHSVIWNAESHSSGVYFIKMVAGEHASTQKLILVK